MTACGRHYRSVPPGRDGRAGAVQFLENSYVFDLVADGAQGVGYLLKGKVGDLRMFTDAGAGSLRASRRSPPMWSRLVERRERGARLRLWSSTASTDP